MVDTGLQSTEAMLIRVLIRTMGPMSIGVLTLIEIVVGPRTAGEKDMSGTNAMKAGKAVIGVDATNTADQDGVQKQHRTFPVSAG